MERGLGGVRAGVAGPLLLMCRAEHGVLGSGKAMGWGWEALAELGAGADLVGSEDALQPRRKQPA